MHTWLVFELPVHNVLVDRKTLDEMVDWGPVLQPDKSA